MTDKRIRIGTDDFSELRDDNGYFVDKSPLIREVIDGSKVTLLPRPRRFGKTLNLSMLRYFFERVPDAAERDRRRALFSGLAIERDAEAMEHFGRYPTIFLTLKDVKGGNWNIAYEKLENRLSELYRRHGEIESALSFEDRKQFSRIRTCRGTRTDVEESLRKLISLLHDYYGLPVVVLIDEYDSPAIEAFRKGYLDEMLDFMRSWLGAALKHENGPALFRAVLTGILRIAKESIFSGLNNLEVSTVLKIGPFEDKFGFTETEVERLLDDFDCSEHLRDVHDWYNGYKFGNTVIYNPWSVLNYVASLPNPIGPQWLNTASNSLVHEELEKGGEAIRRDLEKLLAGTELRYPLREDTVFADVGRNPANIWSFLCFAGYLRAEDPEPDLFADEITYRLSIPNREVRMAYRQFISRVFEREVGWSDNRVREFLLALLKGDVEAFERDLRELVLNLMSYHNVGQFPEAVYHAFVLGLLANLRYHYDIRSEHESGYGRADILMIPKTPRFPLGFVIEFKAVEEGGDADAAVSAAVEQIEKKAYAIRLLEAGVAPENIRKLAVVMHGKDVRVVQGA